MFQVIVSKSKSDIKVPGAIGIIVFIWLSAIVLSLPNFIWRTLSHYEVDLPNIQSVNFCYEDWFHEHGRAYYSLLALIMQYVLPILTVSVAYTRICRKLRKHVLHSRFHSPSKQKKAERLKKTNTLLISITLLFCVSWLPLNLFNLIVDIFDPFDGKSETMLVIYAICHMTGMSSACSNPILYGWLNDNFRKEFYRIFVLLCPSCNMDMGSLADTNVTRTFRSDAAVSPASTLMKVQLSADNNKYLSLPMNILQDSSSSPGPYRCRRDNSLSSNLKSQSNTTLSVTLENNKETLRPISTIEEVSLTF